MAVAVVNQWALTAAQSVTFGQTNPALQSIVIALTSGNSVGGGSGTPTLGNWLVLIAGWNQKSLPAATIAASDDCHSFWRPGNETTSAWTTSTATGNTRTAIWYTANPVRVARNTYAAPSGVTAGMAVLVVELSGTGNWDTVTGVSSNYAAAATTMNLALGAPSAASFVVAAVCGDSSTAGQAFAPGGWTTLHTTTATNGTDHTCDAVLTSAILLTNSGSLSVNGTASSATDLSGSIISFQINAASPVPAANNPNWPYVKFEAAFGGGFQTPPDQLTWTDLTSRLWSWDETTGVQYQLGEIQATDLDLELDNFDNNLASDWPGSPYYSNALNSNMSFQSGVSPWQPHANSTLAQSSAFAYASSTGASATYSLQLTPDGVTAKPEAQSELFAVTVGSSYTVSVWGYSSLSWASGIQVGLNWYNSGRSFLSSSSSSNTALSAATWTQTSITVTAPASAAFAQIYLHPAGTPAASQLFYWAEAAAVPGSALVSTGLITTGVPIRLRAAIATIGGTAANRWYVIQRNAEQWPQQIDNAYRRYVTVTATDMWSTMAGAETTPYRGEVLQDAPYAWWAMDDQPAAGGVQPVVLRNIAPGNSNTLAISQSAHPGVLFYYNTDGWSTMGLNPPASATAQVAQQQGWMYGDPQSSPASYATSSIVTANPGAAAWQASGQAGVLGSQGWYLSCNDSGFPGLSGGVTVECWFNYAYAGSTTSFLPKWTGQNSKAPDEEPVSQQPTMPTTIFELATATAPVAVLQLDQSGHMNLITYNGSAPTSNSIYTASDLRSNSWHHVAVKLTTTTWAVYVDGGATASVTGTATGMTSAWTWLIANGDLGTGGGSSTGAAVTSVQTKTRTATSGTSLTITLDTPTTAGNCLAVTTYATGTSLPAITGITLGGSADNFAAAKTENDGATDGVEIWTDPNCAGGQTAIVITFNNNYTGGVAAWAGEFSGIVTSSPVDQTAGNTATSGSWTSGTTSTLGAAGDIAVGIIGKVSGAATNITPPGGSWTNTGLLTGGSGATQITGWTAVPSTAGVAYAGFTDSSGNTMLYVAAIATLKTAGLIHGGNVLLSHLAVYPSLLPVWRIIAHYWAAFTGFGQVPAPANTSLEFVSENLPAVQGATPATGTDFTPDGSTNFGSYDGDPNGVLASLVVTATTPGAVATSGPSPRAIGTGYFPAAQNTVSTFGSLWTQWTGVAPLFGVYTGSSAGAEKRAALVAGNGDSFINSYANGAVGEGSSQTSGISHVQSKSGTVSSGTTLTVTLDTPTTAGNCLIACIGNNGTLTVSNVKLGGAADNWALGKAQSSGAIDVEIWTDPSCAGGQTAVLITLSGSLGSNTVDAWVMEFSGIAASTPVDQTAGNNGTSANWTSTATATLGQQSEVAFGVMLTAGTNIVGPVDWKNLTGVGGFIAGFKGLSTTTAATYNGSSSNAAYVAAIATLKSTWDNPGLSPPASATATGDTVAQRIERCLGYGKITYPGRAIDPAPLLTAAATDIGGQQTGQNVTNIVHSDGGLLYVDNNGYLHYMQKTELAAQFSPNAAWNISPATTPYYPQIKWIADPQRIWNLITITPFSPENLTLATIGPSGTAQVTASQMQYGPQPLPFTSYLQSQTEMQNQANWLFTNFGSLHVRAENVRIDAAPDPALWPLVLAMNVGDVASVQMWQIGGGGTTLTMRISNIKRHFEFSDKNVEASVVLKLDFEPPSYWS